MSISVIHERQKEIINFYFVFFCFVVQKISGKRRAQMTHIDVLMDDNDDELLCFLSPLFFFRFDTTRITLHSRRPKREKRLQAEEEENKRETKQTEES
jgi:hypothetical protein